MRAPRPRVLTHLPTRAHTHAVAFAYIDPAKGAYGSVEFSVVARVAGVFPSGMEGNEKPGEVSISLSADPGSDFEQVVLALREWESNIDPETRSVMWAGKKGALTIAAEKEPKLGKDGQMMPALPPTLNVKANFNKVTSGLGETTQNFLEMVEEDEYAGRSRKRVGPVGATWNDATQQWEGAASWDEESERWLRPDGSEVDFRAPRPFDPQTNRAGEDAIFLGATRGLLRKDCTVALKMKISSAWLNRSGGGLCCSVSAPRVGEKKGNLVILKQPAEEEETGGGLDLDDLEEEVAPAAKRVRIDEEEAPTE